MSTNRGYHTYSLIATICILQEQYMQITSATKIHVEWHGSILMTRKKH